MQKKSIWGLLAMVLVFGLAVVGCPDGSIDDNGGIDGNDPTSVTYTSYDSEGNVYTLEVTKNQNRAVYTPQAGDLYVLIIKDSTGIEIGKSTGSIKAVVVGSFTLVKGGVEFSISVSGSAIVTITNNIPLDDSTTRTPPDSLSPTKPTPTSGFTLTDIPDEYNGQYAVWYDGQIYIEGEHITDTGNAGLYVPIDNGKVTLPIWSYLEDSDTYSGSGNAYAVIRIYDGDDWQTAHKLAEIRFGTQQNLIVTITNGSATMSWNDGVVESNGNENTPTVTNVTVSPATISVAKGETHAFTATVTGTNSPAQTVTWSIVQSDKHAQTTISSAGLLTVNAAEALSSLTIIATSTADTTKSGTATVAITGGSVDDPCECEGNEADCDCGEDCNCPTCEPDDTSGNEPCECEGDEADCDCGEDCDCPICEPADLVFTSIAKMAAWLDTQPANTAATPYTVKLNIDLEAISGGNHNWYNLRECLIEKERFTALDLSDSTGTEILESMEYNYGGSNDTIDGIVSIILPNTITQIANYAFYGFINLTSINIPNGVESIGTYCFRFCSSLASITIPESVTTIGWWSFDGCSSLTSVTFAGTIPSSGIDKDTFSGTGDLRAKFYATDAANGTPGTYTTSAPVSNASVWTLLTETNPQTPAGFTLTDIPSEYNGKYAYVADGTSPDGDFYFDDPPPPPPRVQISNGKVIMPVGYRGELLTESCTADYIAICIYEDDITWTHLIGIRFNNVAFSNGSISKSWNEGTVQP